MKNKYWYEKVGNDADIVISSRVRLARNLSGFDFSPTLKDEDSKKIIYDVSNVFEAEGFTKTDFCDIPTVWASSYAEKNYISREFACKKSPHALLQNEETGTYIMVCEEDHIRLQCITPGFDLDSAFKLACKYDDILDEKLDIAYDEKLGYLTSCPTNLGTGMRASVMMFLPAITMSNSIGILSKQLSKIGLTIRGMYGEGSESRGALYQISNQITLGISEEDTLKKLNEVISQIKEQERELRKNIYEKNKSVLCDRILRSEGVLRYASLMSSSEFMSLWSDVRLGVALGIVKDIDYSDLGLLFIGAMPATLSVSLENMPQTVSERDAARAAFIKSVLK